jgi:hypothetical protein
VSVPGWLPYAAWGLLLLIGIGLTCLRLAARRSPNAVAPTVAYLAIGIVLVLGVGVGAALWWRKTAREALSGGP